MKKKIFNKIRGLFSPKNEMVNYKGRKYIIVFSFKRWVRMFVKKKMIIIIIIKGDK